MRPLLLALSALTLGFPGAAHALDPCTGTEVKTDRFEETPTVDIGQQGRMLRKSGDEVRALLDIYTLGATDVVLEPGFEVTYLLADGTKVTLISGNRAAPSARTFVSAYAAGVTTSWSLSFPLSAEAVHALAGSPVVSVRYSVGEQNNTEDLSPKEGRLLQTEYACLANMGVR